MPDKTVTGKELGELVSEAKANGKRIVMTNGCFDILHAGHVRYLEAAAGLGDILIVGLNTDASVRAIKGEKRPVMPESARAEVLSGLSSVDYVVLFEETTPIALIREVVPDILVKGGDWAQEQIVGADFIIRNGGQVRTIPLVEGISTSGIISKVISAYGRKPDSD